MSECTHDCSSCSQECSERSKESLLEKPHDQSNIKKVIGVVSGVRQLYMQESRMKYRQQLSTYFVDPVFTV